MAEGLKYDQDKPPMALLDHEFLEEVSRVLAFGANKYAPDNWRGGINYRRLISAAYRHLGSFNSGEDLDPETGRSHLGHLGCCIMFLYWMTQHREDLDDRFRKSADRDSKENPVLSPDRTGRESLYGEILVESSVPNQPGVNQDSPYNEERPRQSTSRSSVALDVNHSEGGLLGSPTSQSRAEQLPRWGSFQKDVEKAWGRYLKECHRQASSRNS